MRRGKTRHAGKPRRLFAIWVLALLLLAAPAMLPGQETGTMKPEFSQVTSKAAARRLVREGRLVRIHFFPRELGGPDGSHNIGYVPPEAADALALATRMIRGQLERGTVDHMVVEPEYKGASIVPSRIRMTARKGDEPGSFQTEVEIW